jgi:HAE1 family hydrophobic/amphiphilic exporter-1
MSMNTTKFVPFKFSVSWLMVGSVSVLVLFAFLGNLRTTLVIATSIPVAILATFILMYVSKFTLNIYSLGGLALGVGMLVDNSTVVLENIFRRFELGENATDAAERGGNEVAASITAGTLTTVAVFLPLIFVQGMSGVLFQQMAYIVTFSMICSLLAALTLVPMITSLVLKSMKRKAESGKQDFAFLRWLDDNYRAAIAWTLSHRLIVCGAVGLVLLVSLGLGRFIPTEFMPVADEGEVRVNGEMQVGTRVEVVAEKFRLIEDMIRQEVPEATDVLTELGATGFGGGNSAHTGQLRIYLKPLSERKRSSAQIANALRKPLANIPGMVVRTRPGQGLYVLRLASGGNTDRLQVDIRGYDLAKSAELAEQVSNLMKEIPGIRDAQISREFGTPEEQIIIDRDKAAALGLTIQDVASALQTVLTGTQAGNYREGGKEYVILVKIAEAEQRSLNELLQMTLNNNQGQPVMLSNVITTQPGLGPVSIARKEQERVITVSADTADRPVDQITAELDRRLREMNLPPDFTVGLAGDIEEQQKSFQQLALSLILSLALIYMIMAAQYESLLHPFVVMFAVPLSAIGVILTLLATNTSLNLQSFIGIIMLGGIVVNNAIILVDTINQLRREQGMELRAAVEEAGYRRLRPILMTTLTTLLGLVPLALGLGEGAEAQAPMARTVIGGLASSTLFTLFVVPIFYFTFEGWAGRWQQWRQRRQGGLSHEV